MAKDKTDGLRQYAVSGYQTDAKGNTSGDSIRFSIKAADLPTAYKDAKAQVQAIIGGQSSTHVEEMDEGSDGKSE